MKTLLARLTTQLAPPHGVTARWSEIRLGRKREVTCSCGGRLTDRPHEFDFTITSGACSHLIALYAGNVTGDKRHMKTRPFGAAYYVQLTVAGKSMFRWRWAALALAQEK